MRWIALPWPRPDEGPAPGAEAAAAGWWALRFTPRVALVDGEAVLLEVASTERLWGGRDALRAQVLQAWAQAADTDVKDPAPCGCGPTSLAALAFLRAARVGRGARIARMQDLPVHTLTAWRPHAASLERMGCRTWGALRALPRAGLSRRFGAAALQALDQALGDAPEAHDWLALPEQFALSAELPALAESADALLWSAGRCLAALRGWLQARQRGALGLELAWRHDLRRVDGVAVPPTQALRVRTAQATQDVAHLRRLLAEHLARTTLAAPARQITLRLLESAPLPHRSASLLPPDDRGGPAEAPGEALHQLLERLSARLGAGSVQAPLLRADHRPECMQQWRPAAELLLPGRAPATDLAADRIGPHAPDAALWPTWLLRPPRRLALQGHHPCHHGPLRLLAGPHRFEAGWWCAGEDSPDDPGLAQRDYFVAHNAAAGLVWVFRERVAPAEGEATGEAEAAGRHRWFLHGLFG